MSLVAHDVRAPSFRPTLLVALLLGVHLALVAHFIPRRVLQSGVPVLTDVFAIEAYRTARVRVSLDSTGQAAAYDPQVLAGQSVGMGEPLGTRVFPIGVSVLSRFGVLPGRAFNALVLALHAVWPLIGYAAARAFGLRKRAACVTMGLWSALWFFDALVHFTWFSGRLPWAVASGMVVITLGCAHRFAAGGRGGWAFAAVASGIVTAFLHPLAAVLGAGASVVAAFLGSGQLAPRRLGLLIAAVLPLLPLALLAARGAPGSSEPLSVVFHVGPAQMLWDFLEVLGPGYGAPGATRTLVRTLCLVAGFVGLGRMRALGDRRFAYLVTVMVGAFVVAYGGGLVHVAWPMDPYFLAVPATLAASVPGAALLSDLPWLSVMRDGTRLTQLGLFVAALLVVPRAVRTVLTFFPELLPDRVINSPADWGVSPLVGLDEPMPDAMSHDLPVFRFTDVANWLLEHGAQSRRVLVDDAALTGFLAVTTPLPVLGPIAERGASARAADPSRLLDAPATSLEVAAFLSRYGVGWVVLGGPLGPFDRNDPELGPMTLVAGFRVRPVMSDVTLFAAGEGQIDVARLGSIRVSGAEGNPVTLRFHYDPRLACRPSCRVERAVVPFDDAGFLSVPEPPAEFELYVR